VRGMIGTALRAVANVIDPQFAKLPEPPPPPVPPSVNAWEDDEHARKLRKDAALLVLAESTAAALVVAVADDRVVMAGEVQPQFWPAIAATMLRVAEEAAAGIARG
jgi:hypothetical protein